jgi:hypothetical protein
LSIFNFQFPPAPSGPFAVAVHEHGAGGEAERSIGGDGNAFRPPHERRDRLMEEARPAFDDLLLSRRRPQPRQERRIVGDEREELRSIAIAMTRMASSGTDSSR